MEEEIIDLSTHDLPLSSNYILSQVDDLIIYRHYLGPFVLGKKVKHPFRQDKHPSFSVFFSTRQLRLLWKDHSTGESGDCFSLVGKLLGLNYGQVLHRIGCDCGLVRGCESNTVSKKLIQEAKDFKENFQQQEYLIQADFRKMSEAELAYWAQYYISQADLKTNNIYGIKTLWVNGKEVYLRPGLHFAYLFPDVDKLKIYSPEEEEWKWFGNVSSFKMEGVDKLIPSLYEPLIITKSRKDRIILSKLYPNVCSCQNEAEAAIPKEMDEKFDSMYPAKYCWFDSDEPGKTANRKLNHRGYKWINVPNQYYEQLGLKDPGDIIKHFGWEDGSKILKKEINRKLKYERQKDTTSPVQTNQGT